MKRLSIIALSIMLMLFFGTVSSFGTVDKDSGYGYTITIYAGQQGHFGSNENNKTKTIKVKSGAAVTIDIEEMDFHLDNDEYYVRGLRQTGHDNDEIKSLTIPSVDEDISYEVAYGIKGGMVSYEVHYVSDKDGTELRESDTYYGMVGDKPVVSCKYIDNYMPDAYNKTKTLSEDESQNVFDFAYAYTGKSSGSDDSSDSGSSAAGGNNGNGTTGNTANNAGANTGTGADADNNTNGAAATIDGNETPKGLVDLDNGETPMANSDGSNGFGGSPVKPLLIGGGLAAAAIILAAVLLARRRKYQET